MTCAQVLATLSTASLREMTPDSAVMAHCATCPDCARVTTMVREKEYEAASVLNGLPPMSNPIAVAEQAMITSKRRRLGRVAVMITGATLAMTIWIAGAMLVIPAMNRNDSRIATLRTETMPLTCLSPQQAADIINPYVRSHGSTYYIPSSGISAITVRGTSLELAQSRNLIRDFEKDPSADCHLSYEQRSQKMSEALARAAIAGGAAGKVPTTVPDNVPPAGNSKTK
jgi:hypothetical protein